MIGGIQVCEEPFVVFVNWKSICAVGLEQEMSTVRGDPCYLAFAIDCRPRLCMNTRWPTISDPALSSHHCTLEMIYFEYF